MVNITYTQGQLEGFTVKELNSLDLFNRMGEVPKLNKADLIDLMMRFQAKEVADAKSDETTVTPEATNEESKIPEVIENKEPEDKSDDSDEDEDEDESEKEAKDEKPIVFHRKNNKGNTHSRAMSFK